MSSNFVKFNAIQTATGMGARVLTNTVKKYAENARTSISGATVAPRLQGFSVPQFRGSILEYPFSVDDNVQQGHHVLFHIYDQVKGGKLTTAAGKKNKKSGKEIEKNIMSELNISEENLERRDNEGAPQVGFFPSLEDYAIMDAGNVVGLEASRGPEFRSLQLEQSPKRERKKTIALYMPQNVDVSYQVSYGDQEVGSFAMSGSKALLALMGPGSMQTRLTNAYNELLGGGSEGLDAFIQATADTFATGARALMQINKGTVITPRMELMFEGVGRRDFSYTFTMIPKHEEEARVINEIVYNFKRYMMPEYENDTTRKEMRIPAFFEIEYRYGGAENDFLNKVSTCFLKQMDVKYGGDRFTAHELTDTKLPERPGSGFPPQRTEITLNFTELETMHRGLVETGH